MIDLDTGALRTFSPAPNNEEPTWSPDGMHFVASTGDCQNKEYRLTLFDAETGDTVPLDTNCPMSIDPFWGDDDRIYFACGARTGNGDFFSINPDGTDLRAMGLSARRPTLSPDGKHIAYMVLEEDVWRIWVGELNAGGQVINPKQMPFPQVLGGVYARQPKWNSDGTRLYFNVTDQSSLLAMALASVELETGSTNVSFITADDNTPFVRPVCGMNNVCVAGGASGGLWLLNDVGGVLTPVRRITFGEDFGADVYP
jgi:Tol biopolymer transport system component